MTEKQKKVVHILVKLHLQNLALEARLLDVLLFNDNQCSKIIRRYTFLCLFNR